MLTDGIADAYRASVDRLGAISDISMLVGEKTGERGARPYLIETTAELPAVTGRATAIVRFLASLGRRRGYRYQNCQQTCRDYTDRHA